MRYDTMWFIWFQNLQGLQLFTLALTMKVKGDWPPELISWVADHMQLSHQVWSWSDNRYSKNKGLLTTCFDYKMVLTFKWRHQWRDCYWWIIIQEMLYRCKAFWARNMLNKNDYIQKKPNKHLAKSQVLQDNKKLGFARYGWEVNNRRRLYHIHIRP
jgi:hypothetical protein